MNIIKFSFLSSFFSSNNPNLSCMKLLERLEADYINKLIM